MSGKIRFYGTASHAAAAPERGRSALDAVEALNYMVNMMREHVQEDARIHYVITRGGEAPNVVPAFAEVYYYARHPKMQ
jgi:aminobenzoyl-glutamate utilization protein B